MNKLPQKDTENWDSKTYSVTSRVIYLKLIIKSPYDYRENMSLLIALKSQSGVAKLSVSELSISPMSLNTLKNRANVVLLGGFAEIDNLRHLAYKAIQSLVATKPTLSPSSLTKQYLKNKIKEQEKVISQLWDEIALVTNVFRETINLAHQFAEKCSDPAELNLFKKRRRELLSMLSLSKKSITTYEVKSSVE
ncbi:TPA: hypothetical protein ACJI3N_004024 [Raoultella planticola]